MNDRFVLLKIRRDDRWVFDKAQGRVFAVNESGFDMLTLICKNKGKREIKTLFEKRFELNDADAFEKDYDYFYSLIKRKEINGSFESGHVAFPLQVLELFLTYRCNLSCRHCYQKERAPSMDMPLSLVERLIQKSLSTDSIERICFFGGEPFLHKDIYRILRMAHPLLDKGRTVQVSTNGTLFAQGDFKKIDKRIQFFVSLDGTTEERHAAIRGSGHFHKTLTTIKALIDNENPVTINFVVNRYTWKDMRGICCLGRELGVTRINFLPQLFINSPKEMIRDLVIPQGERAAFLDEKERVKEEFKGFFAGRFLDLNLFSDSYSGPERSPVILFPCPAGTKKCVVKPNGDAIPCDYLQEYVGGNLNDVSLDELWKYPHSRFERSRFPYVVDEEDMPECRGCENASLCFRDNLDNVLFSSMSRALKKEVVCYKKPVLI